MAESKSALVIDDAAVSLVEQDIQRIINCVEEGGRIIFRTNTVINPTDTIIFNRSLTLTGFTANNPTDITLPLQTEERVHFSCPLTGGTLFVIRTQNITISSAVIQDCSQENDPPVIVDSCRSYREQASIQFSHVTLINNSNSGSASIIDQRGSCVTLDFFNVEIINNDCGENGCIRLEGNASFQQTRVSGNKATNPFEEEASLLVLNSGVYVLGRNIEALDNNCRTFHVRRSNLHLSESSFLRSSVNASNFAMSMEGGVIAAQNSNITINNCLFVRNTASDGGVLDARYSQVQISNSTFYQNRASDGQGGIMNIAWSTLLMLGCNCSENTGPFVSAIYINASSFVISSVTVERGPATLMSAVYILLSNGSIDNSIFLENTGYDVGGAIQVTMSTVDINNTQFLRNTGSAGTAGLQVILHSIVSVHRCLFEGNRGSQFGGGLGVGLESRVIIHDSRFTNNTADEGGAISCEAGSHVTLIRTSVFSNRAYTGGGISLNNGSTLYAEDLDLRDNYAASEGGGLAGTNNCVFTVNNSLVQGNMAVMAAGIAIINGHMISRILSSRIVNNNALRFGGGVRVLRSFLEINDAQFEENFAASGGGISASMSNLTVGHCYFLGNSVTERGGDIDGDDTNTTLTDLTSLAGQSDASAGSLFLSRTHLIISNIRISRSSGFTLGSAMTIRQSTVWMNGIQVDSTSNSSLIAIYFLSCTLNATNLTMSNNDGMRISPLAFHNSTVSMNRSIFFNNSGQFAGAVYVIESSVFISETSFEQNFGSRYGGCIYVRRNSLLNIEGISFRFCAGRLGGAILSFNSQITIGRSTFVQGSSLNNGGAISGWNTTAYFMESNISCNNANLNGGGISLMQSSEASIVRCSFDTNSALVGGAIYMHSSSLNSTDSRYSNNRAQNGGGMYLYHGIYFIFSNATFQNNTAVENGGAISIVSNDRSAITLQVTDSTFTQNRASYGGGLHAERQTMNSANCASSGAICGGVAIIGTVFRENRANESGAAVQANDPSVIRVNCLRRTTIPQSGLITVPDFLTLQLIEDSNLCQSWITNIVSEGGYGGVVGSYAKSLDVSFLMESSQRPDQVQNTGLSLLNHRSGQQLPTINIMAVDQYGNGPAPVVSRNLTVSLSSPDGFFPGVIPLRLIDSMGNFSAVVGFKPPGDYHLVLTSDDDNIEDVEIMVNIRECRIGEQPTSDRILCEPCDALSYNFNPEIIGGCTQCPDHSECTTQFIVPDLGYWQSSPCSTHSQRCITEVACETNNRTNMLEDFLEPFLTCELTEEDMALYLALQCEEGYTGVLCGSCENDYGRYWSFECAKCLHSFFSILFMIFLILWLLFLTVLTIRGNLPFGIKITKNLEERHSSNDSSPVARSSSNVQQLDGSSSQRISPFYSRLDETRWYTTEVLKITINFVQVVAIAARLDVDWTSSISGLLETTGYLGGATTEAMTQSIDCLTPSDSSSVSRPVMRYIVSVLVPFVVVLVLAVFWIIQMKRKKFTFSFFWKRVLLSTIAVAYISYTGMTEVAIRVFCCVNVFDSATAKNLYWAIDTSLKCFQGDHVIVLLTSIAILIILTIGFPLLCLFILIRYLKDPQLEESCVFETMGFLYRAFDKKYAFWESTIMLRKAAISGVAVFAYPLGAEIQADLVVLILVACLFSQLVCKPYRQDFHRLNSYEAVSLLLSIATYILAKFFEHAKNVLQKHG
eukprot:g5235.t1